MADISENLRRLSGQIQKSVPEFKRNVDEIKLLAVSKGHSPSAIREAYNAGLRDFGENYPQEALDKIRALGDLSLHWHFIGAVQGNKTRDLAQNFSWVHSVDRIKIARRLSDQRPKHMPALNVCLQLNIDREPGKAGVAEADLADLAVEVAQLPRLKLRGLMIIPRPQTEYALQREVFHRTAVVFANLRQQWSALAAMDTLSMGMSRDYPAAVAEGATIIRVGTALFGARPGRAPSNQARHQLREGSA